LRDQIREAVGLEDFERAAELRDRLLSLKEKTEI
ncbi:MAG: UvrB/UvrC motif-containing protein, partial [Candidatus Latescibacteria bacterium]|nr:UvrB/UvrC motif-containing protein [Candidatus Latescibacterota bacterium]